MKPAGPLRIVHTEASLGWGGQEIRILTEAQGMIARGHAVQIWAAPGSDIVAEAARRGVSHRVLPIGRKNVRGLLALRRALVEARPDVVNTHSSTDAWLVALACLALRDPPPMVRTRHISSPVPRDPATHWLYNHATRHIVTTGERLREILVRENRLRAARITSIPTGVDATRFHPADKGEARRELGLDPGARYIGIVATLRSWKGHLYLIDAFALLARTNLDLRLLIVGDGPMQPTLQARVEQLALGARVLLAGRQDAPERWLQAMDVFCLPSYANEGVPQAVVQAMLTGLPIVTTAVGSITEAITENRTGVIVPPKDTAALADAIQRLLADSARAQRMGVAARADAERRFDEASMVERMETILRDVIERHRKRRRGLSAHWRRLRQSIRRRWKEWRLPAEYVRLGTRYGGWWLDARALGPDPLLIDCGLGRDISFPAAFIARFGGTVIGIDPNPESIEYCRANRPAGMEIWNSAFWTQAGKVLAFHLPRAKEDLPPGADGISGSLVHSHAYVGGGARVHVTTTSFDDVLQRTGRSECDVLKLDIEGAEYDVLEDLCARDRLRCVRQLLVEFHHGATHRTAAETATVVGRVQHAGLRLMHVEGRNYIFRRNDLG